MTQQVSRIQRQIADIARLRQIISRVDKSRLCAVCNTHLVYLIREGAYSMTCDRLQCKRAWLLNEPYRCEFCKSFDFKRLDMQWDGRGHKLYHCDGCSKTYAVHQRRAIETVADTETDEVG